ncbi:unnamed protein product [Brachionus calyciflorus]|uniref:Uncharacterized protein n=1 Tax=Brachionus calyciflorus TaxID=104777 RepID=A0A813SXA9_9BILA|nr:unnamed protein product [Brachionus calyciflorus]
MNDQNEIGGMIKEGIKTHLDYTVQQVISHNGWDRVNIREISENDLLSMAQDEGLSTDSQIRDFCKFISIATNFSSLDFCDRLQEIPALVNSLKDLISKMQQEILEYAEIASFFHTLIQSFLKLVMNTKHNMKMAVPHLEEVLIHMEVMSDALLPNSDLPLSSKDIQDVDFALSNMSNGIVKMLEHAKCSKEKSNELDQKINNLKENIENRITIVENRVHFGNILPRLGATIGMISGVHLTNMAVESIMFGGTGALVLGGFTFPPLGAILLGSAIGAFGTGSIVLFIKILWEKQQFKALGYLREILEKLNQLNSANLAFMDYMNKSEEDANKILTNIEFFKTMVTNGSQRYRKLNANICRKAIESTNNMIETIHEITNIDLKKWIEERDEPTFTMIRSGDTPVEEFD